MFFMYVRMRCEFVPFFKKVTFDFDVPDDFSPPASWQKNDNNSHSSSNLDMKDDFQDKFTGQKSSLEDEQSSLKDKNSSLMDVPGPPFNSTCT